MMRAELERYWSDISSLVWPVALEDLTLAAHYLNECREHGRTVFVCGNGGSAATATHFACDLAKGTQVTGGPKFRVVSLVENMSMLTAWANDTSYDRVFAEQLEPLAQPGDLLVAISASGSSPNVLEAARVARRAGMRVIAFTGQTGGQLRNRADLTIRVPSDEIEQVEDIHLIMAHSLCVTLRESHAHRLDQVHSVNGVINHADAVSSES